MGRGGVGVERPLRQIPAAGDAPTLDELLAEISAMALGLLPDNHPDVASNDLFLQLTTLREAELVGA
jgi:hypothetical protein